MALHDWWQLFYNQLLETGWLQWMAVILGVAEVLFARVNNIWLYPTGIVGTLLSIYILLEAGLFADSLLNGYYVAMSIYGWWYWVKKNNVPPVRISQCTKQDWLVVLAISIGGFILLAAMLKKFTPSTVPFWDAWVSATAWAGMWLLAKRKTENWLLLNISNAFAVPLLLFKQLPMFAVLTVFLFVIAVQGYFEWLKIARPKQPAQPILAGNGKEELQ